MIEAQLPLEPWPKDALVPMPGVELFFGLVGPTGTDTSAISTELTEQLKQVGYKVEIVSLSDLITEFTHSQSKYPAEYDRIKDLMRQGTELREQSESGDIVARLGLGGIRAIRKQKCDDENRPLDKTAFVIKSFKRPEEVQLFREIYGRAFNLISIYMSVDDRLAALSKRLAQSARKNVASVEHQALELINKDASEEGKTLGQDVRDTFPLADFFVAVKDGIDLKSQLRRLVHLVFGNPFLTPSKEEYAMFFAQAAALRSGDLSRQIGAAIVSDDGDLISAGCNEVPKAGGGLYWSDDPFPKRDYELGFDKNAKVKQELVEDLLHRLKDAHWLDGTIAKLDISALYAKAIGDDKGRGDVEVPPLKDCQILDVIEYGRTVHAEMAALTDAARRGLEVQGARLFSTTFPCHLCAKHIISAGIKEVIYIEPYPKSRTKELYPDSVVVNPKERVPDKVNFFPFSGVAPRRYFDFFQMAARRKTSTGEVLNWKAEATQPKVKRFVLSYISLEVAALQSVPSQKGES